jgi:endonuclease YncB( thermonuclease family)
VLATIAVVTSVAITLAYYDQPARLSARPTSIAAPEQGQTSKPALKGIARVIDGDTIDIRGLRVRLNGIDAPERKQTCEKFVGGKYACGVQSTEALIRLLGANEVQCEKAGTDRNGRMIGRCKTGEIDIGAWMVEQGWALAYRRYSMVYVDAENRARAAKSGMWAGAFVIPEEWRRSQQLGGLREQQ